MAFYTSDPQVTLLVRRLKFIISVCCEIAVKICQIGDCAVEVGWGILL